MLTVHAHAKINLSLEVLGRRPDGYHELISVMQTVSLHDELHVTAADGLEMTCSDPALESADNLVLCAALLLQRRFDVRQGCRIRLEKHIPAAAGLGGGSSDAAATLTALSRAWSLNLACDDLLALAAELGSDVPFFLYAGTALVEGRGERVRRLASAQETSYVLARPTAAVSTATIFHNLPPSDWTNGAATRALAADIALGGHARTSINDLERTLFRLHPEARRCYEAVRSATGDASVSGSGPTVLAVCNSQEEAEYHAQSLRSLGYWSTATRSFVPKEITTPCA